VIPEGSVCGRKIYIVLDGKLLLNDEIIAERLTCFGSRWIREMDNKELFTNPIIAKGSVEIAECELWELESMMGGSFPSITAYNNILDLLGKIYMFKCLPPSKMFALVSQFETLDVCDQTVIIQEG
jgi:hypothetical protein